MACPFFMPTQKSDEGAWLHPSRLPLGGGWRGHCCAPGNEGAEPGDAEMQELCNMGYALSCPRLPAERTCDAVRFGIAHDGGTHLAVWFVCEAAHRPADRGQLEYDFQLGRWISSHADARIQKMAECYLESYLRRRTQPARAGLTSSTNPCP